MPYYRLHRAIAPLMGASHLLPRIASHVENALSRILRSGGGLLLVGTLLFFARATDAQVSWTISPTSFPEDVGVAEIVVTYTGSGFTTLRAETRDGTATAGASNDYIAVTQAPWAVVNGTTQTIRITINDDDDSENDEYFILSVNGGTQRITIQASDPRSSVSPDSFAENAGTAAITVTNTGSAVGLTYATKDGTAKAGTDYTAVPRTSTSSTVAANGTITVNVTIIADTSTRESKHFFLTVNDFDHRITITDASPAPTLTVSPLGGRTVNEGAGNFVYTVTLAATPPIVEDVTVRCLTRDFRSTDPDVQPQPVEDFTLVDETLTFTPGGATSQTCAIPIIDDTVNESRRNEVRYF